MEQKRFDRKAEWLETDGLGGFASGTVEGIRTRRYHALLLVATTPPTGRVALVNGFEAWVETPEGRTSLTSQRYTPDVIHPDGHQQLIDFTPQPWPTWTFRLAEGTSIQQSLFIPHGQAAVVLTWKLLTPRPACTLPRQPLSSPQASDIDGTAPSNNNSNKKTVLFVRPLLSGRDYHALHHENTSFNFTAKESASDVEWHPYFDLPKIQARSNGTYQHDPAWYRNFLYLEEKNRGLDSMEDLASPGIFKWDLSAGEAQWALSTQPLEASVHILRAQERTRRRAFASPLLKAADDYVVQRGTGKTIVAGYPWFTDWGRDTFIALRGLCVAGGRLDVARQILLEWAGVVSEGMLPNLFPDRGGTPEYNSVDASLWYIIAIHDYRQASCENPEALTKAVDAILDGYTEGTRFGIRMDTDGLLACGAPGAQLTWMDAKVGDWVVTPRSGKPVEIQALWINALRIAGRTVAAEKAQAAFEKRFWNEATRSLFDVVDAAHMRGLNDATLRPNQIFAVGGLPFPLLKGEKAQLVVETVERELLTPLGLRSLAPHEKAYAPRYEGGVLPRDGSYHQGTVWPWLMGAFAEAWLRVHAHDPLSKTTARERFVQPLLTHLEEAGLGHVSEIADADFPHTPRGCPFQAWSLGELIRMERLLSPEPTELVRNPTPRALTGSRTQTH